MPKVKFNGITFDSEIEMLYFQQLKSDARVIDFLYQPTEPIMVNQKSKYTPDFIVEYEDRVEIIELKGYNPYSKLRDDMIHNFMLYASPQLLRDFIVRNGFYGHIKPVQYKKLKHLKTYGFVDWDFKNPNTIANKRKEKIQTQTAEIKELKAFKKKTERYFECIKKKAKNQKLTKPQLEFMKAYEDEFIFKQN